ncbi:hypothetical protein [Acidithiobacillus sulfuriphilus]|uniref:Uncharacterized protein n=1 Tax=Acidithiobacillus sulfuriphilus TaxID=1867749 RepID=A0ACD5HS66_9PROT|nr:hypothetical protein [Acidithiobacillus sulfuriphilus]
MVQDYGYADRQRLIAQARAELEKEMQTDVRLWMQVHWRRWKRRGLFGGRTS